MYYIYIYINIEEFNLNKKRKILIVSSNTMADILSNKKLSLISVVFITESYFAVPKNIRLNCTHYLEIPYKQQLQHITFNHSSDIDF